MSYDHRLLCDRISLSLHRSPDLSLGELSLELSVCRRTIQNALIAVKGKRFSELRDDLFLARVHSVLMSRPGSTIKELCFEISYRSPRSFARAVRRVCDASPRQLRSLIADELVASKKYRRLYLATFSTAVGARYSCPGLDTLVLSAAEGNPVAARLRTVVSDLLSANPCKFGK